MDGGEGGEGQDPPSEGEDWILENFLEKKSVQASLPKVFVGIFGSVKILGKTSLLDIQAPMIFWNSVDLTDGMLGISMMHSRCSRILHHLDG